MTLPRWNDYTTSRPRNVNGRGKEGRLSEHDQIRSEGGPLREDDEIYERRNESTVRP